MTMSRNRFQMIEEVLELDPLTSGELEWMEEFTDVVYASSTSRPSATRPENRC